MKEKKTKEKKKGTGFGLRLASAIFFTIAAIGLIVGSIFFYSQYHKDTFIGWFNSGNSSEYISQDEIVHQDSEKEYNIYYGIKLISDYDDYQYSAEEKQELKAKSPYIKADYTVVGAASKTDVYYFYSEDAAAKTATFKNEAGELLTVNYSELHDYEYYLSSNGWNYYGGFESFIVMIVFASLSTVLALLQIIGAFAGKKHRGGNNLCIATGAFMMPALIGFLAFFGGLKGNDAINEKYPEKAKKQGNGFGLRLTFAIIILLFAISYSLGTCLCLMLEGYLALMDIMLIGALPGLIIAVFAVLLIVGAVAGKKHRWGNILHIVFGAITAPGYIGLFALVGGINGNKAIANMSVEENKQEEVPQVVQPVLEKSEAVAETVGNTIADYPVDYVNKPAVSCLLDLNNRENLFLENEDGTAYEFHQLYVTVRQGTIYALTQTVGLDEDMRVVFRVDYASDTFHIEEDEKICEAVWNEYVSAVNAQEEEYVEEYIQPKTSPKAKKGITIAAAVSYGLLLIMGILFAAVPAMSGFFSGLGICAEVSARAYGISIGTMWVTLATAAGYVFVTISPWSPGKKGKIIIAAVSTVLLVVMNVVFFVIINTVKLEVNYELLANITDKKEQERWLKLLILAEGGALPVKSFFEGADSWFIPVSTVFASLSIIACHALMFFKINPNKIKARKPQKGGDGIAEIIKHILASIVYGIMCLIKFILTFKEKLPEVFILVAAILLTWLAHFVSFVVAIVVIVMLIGVVVMYFAGVISWAYTPGASSSADSSPTDEYYKKKEYTYTDSYGYEQTVYSDDEKNFYDAGGHYVGSSGDGGNFKKKD